MQIIDADAMRAAMVVKLSWVILRRFHVAKCILFEELPKRLQTETFVQVDILYYSM